MNAWTMYTFPSRIRAVTLLALGSLASCGDTVAPEPEARIVSLEIVLESDTLLVGERLTLRAAGITEVGESVDEVDALWSSSDTTVAVIDSDGAVRGVASGLVTLTATADEASAAVDLIVTTAPSRWAAVNAGGDHTCAIGDDATIWCWGRANQHQLGVGSQDSRGVPSRVQTDARFVSMDAKGWGNCGIAQTGDVYCWGLSLSSYPGSIPRVTVSGRSFTAIHAGHDANNACGLQPSGAIYCWVYGTPLSEVLSHEKPGPYRDVIANQPCGLTDFAVECWSGRTPGAVHEAFRSPEALAQLTGGGSGACVRSEEGLVYCSRQIMHGVAGAQSFRGYEPIPGDLRFDTIDAGHELACGLRDGGTAWCWAFVYGGAMSRTSEAPVRIDTDHRFTSISAGSEHACGLTADGEVYCWGSNRYGQLGTDEVGGSEEAPVRVPAPRE